MRSLPNQILDDVSPSEIIFGSSNKYIHLFDPVLLFKIMGVIFKTKFTPLIYCHTFLS